MSNRVIYTPGWSERGRNKPRYPRLRITKAMIFRFGSWKAHGLRPWRVDLLSGYHTLSMITELYSSDSHEECLEFAIRYIWLHRELRSRSVQ